MSRFFLNPTSCVRHGDYREDKRGNRLKMGMSRKSVYEIMGSWGVHAHPSQPGVATTLPRGFLWAEMEWQCLQTWGHRVWGKVGMNHRVKYQDFVNICILNDELLSDSFLPYPFPLPEFWQPGRKLGMTSLETWPKRKDSQMAVRWRFAN